MRRAQTGERAWAPAGARLGRAGARLDEQAERVTRVGRARGRHQRAQLVALRLLHKVRALRVARARARRPRPPLQARLADELCSKVGAVYAC